MTAREMKQAKCLTGEAIRDGRTKRGPAMDAGHLPWAASAAAERQAAEIRIRAERRWGQVYRQQEKAEGSKSQLIGRDSSGGITTRPPEKSAPTLESLGVSKQQSSTWQKLAEVSDKDFETALNKAGAIAAHGRRCSITSS